MVPTVLQSRRGKPVWVRLTNVSNGTARCYKHSSVVLWIPKRELPREVGYVRLDSSKYNKWQVLAYAEGRDDTLLQKEKELYECWLAEQPPAAGVYNTCAHINEADQGLGSTQKSALGHSGPDDRGDGMNSHRRARMRNDSEASVAVGVDEEKGGEPNTQPTEFSDVGDDEKDPAEVSVDMLELTYISLMHENEAEIAAGDKGTDDDWYEHIANEMELADYAHELAFLPDLTEPSSTVLDYAGPNVMSKSLGKDEQRELVEVLQRHEEIMIASGNALPPPAYGVISNDEQRVVGFVQPKGGWKEYSERMRLAEENVERTKTGVTESSTKPRFKFEAGRESASNPDPVSKLANSSIGDMFTNEEPAESSLVPVFDRRALSRKTKRTWSLLSDKFISYYCSQFSQSASIQYYRAKHANIKFERSGREAKEHVQHFLETCGDRDLERQLTPMQLRDIHTPEGIVSDIQKVEKRVSNRSSSQDRFTELQTRASSEIPDEYSNDYSNDDPIDFYEGDEAD
ncbi:hypothetical protein PHMEG_00032619 [Phytophthora megakarya]|uniref:Uncharacterized protein n=1 Tax=Phytophthora megakarya TaxID=4795 RepID=A0A225UV78_9STRA|nr:hypothetical protein PHMEG_00032619 [Phytophthora megakarya]